MRGLLGFAFDPSQASETRDNFLSKGIAMRYLYYDKDSKYVAEVEIKPENCGK